jgi:L-ascorbate metabolism protein UlaG (beta-lactamase superfamily)
MKITKFGHACFLVEESDARILIDPGSYSTSAANVENLNAILITHNHQDHLDPELIKTLLAKNPSTQVITVAEAGKNLEEAGIPYVSIEDGAEVTIAGVSVRSFGKHHSYIYGDMPQCQNTGFMIADRLYHPGDSLHQPGVPVEILALPVAGPWMKLSECIDYAKAVKPRVVIPIHDGFIREDRGASLRRFPTMFLEPDGIAFRDMSEGSSETF